MQTKAEIHRVGYSNAGKKSYPQPASYFAHKKVLANVDNLDVKNTGMFT